MGLLLSKLATLYASFSQSDPARILMLGIDGAGKTTVLYKLKLDENVCTIPTIGFNVETIKPTKGISFTVWDVGGQDAIRKLWRHYYQNTEGLIYIVDSADRYRLKETRHELFGILQDDNMRNVPVVVMANKQDLPGALKPYELIEELGLREVREHKWHIQGCCAVTGDGLYEAVNTLTALVHEFKRNNRS